MLRESREDQGEGEDEAEQEGGTGEPRASLTSDRLTLRRTLPSIERADANNQEVPRTRAGTAGNNVGLRSGDQCPTTEPCFRVTPCTSNPPGE